MANIRSALAAALLIFGAASVASAQRPLRPAAGARALRRADAAMMRGVQLSDAERTNVKAVRQKYAAQQKTLRTTYAPQLAGMRDARQRGDTAALRSFRQTARAARTQSVALNRSQQNDIRAALDSTNRAKFDANAARVRQRLAKRGKSVTP